MIATPPAVAPRSADRDAPAARARAGALPVALAILAGAVLTALHILALHQGPGWTSPLLIGDHLFDLGLALTLVLYALALGRKVARPLLGLGDDALTEGLVALGLGLGLLSLGTLAAGFLHLYYGIAFLAGAVALTVWLRGELAAILQGAGSAIVTWIRGGLPTAPTLGLRVVLAILVLDLLLLAPRATLPISINGSIVDWDALTYHLTAPQVYVTAHAIVPRPDIPLAMAPSGWDLLYTLGLFAGTDTLPRMLSILATLLLGLATFALGRRLFGRAAGWLGMLLFFSTSWLAAIAHGPLPDFGATFLIVVAAGDLLVWADRTAHGTTAPVHTAARPPWLGLSTEDRRLLRAGILIGIGVSFKLTNLPAIPAVGITIALACLLAARGSAWQRAGTLVRSGVLAGVGMALPLAPWLLKSLYYFGNPLYPTSVQVAQTQTGGTLAGGAGAHASAVVHLWQVATTIGTTYWHYIGPFSMVLLLAPLVLRRPIGYIVAILVLAGALLWYAFVPLYLPPRYWLALIAVSDAVAAAAICSIAGRPLPRPIHGAFFLVLLTSGVLWLAYTSAVAPSSFWLSAVVVLEVAFLLAMGGLLRQRERADFLLLPVIACLCLNGLLGGFLEVREANDNREWSVASGALSREDFVAGNSYFYPAFRWVNRHTPSEATVVLVSVVPPYYLDRPYLADPSYSRLADLRSHPQDELAAWCRAGVRYMIFGEDAGSYGQYAWARTPGLGLRLLFSANTVDVVAVHPCAAVRG